MTLTVAGSPLPILAGVSKTVTASAFLVTAVTPLTLTLATAPATAANQVVAVGATAGIGIAARAEVPTLVGGTLTVPNQQPQPNMGEQGFLHLAFTADAFGNLFISGDTGEVDSIGNAYLFTRATNTWTQLVAQTNADNPARPHADTRNLVLNPAAVAGSATVNVGRLFAVTDGGVYALDLSTNPRVWMPVNGDPNNPAGGLRINEVSSTAYDPLTGTIFGGAQDNGEFVQDAIASNGLDDDFNGLVDDPAERFAWPGTNGGDGNTALAVPVDTDGDGKFDHVLHYVLANNLIFFNTMLYDNAGASTTARPGLGVPIAASAVSVTVDNLATNVFRTAAGTAFTLPTHIPYLLSAPLGLPAGTRSNVPYYVVLEAADNTRFTLRQFTPTGPVVDVGSAGIGTIRLTPVVNITAAGNVAGLLPIDRAYQSGFQVVPMAVNATDPSRMLMGLCNLYESDNYLTTITRVGPAPSNDGCYSAVEYGGIASGQSRWEVVYGARGGKVVVRLPETPTSATIKAFKSETLAGANQIRDLVLDPRDYRIAYAVTDVGVFKRSGGSWSLVSQKLINVNFQSIEFVPGATAAEDVLLVGTALGVFRAFNPQANVSWTELGTNLPNAIVRSLDYVATSYAQYQGVDPNSSTNHLLIAGTHGRSIWTINAADAALHDQPIIELRGADGVNDTFLIARNAANASLVDITVNGVLVFSAPLTTLHRIVVLGGSGTDTLTVDSANGAIALPGGIHFTGGADADADTVVFTGGKVHGVKTTTPAAGQRRIAVDDVFGGGTEVVLFIDFVSGTDTISDTLPRATAAEKTKDGITKLLKGTSGPKTELALLGSTLPRAIRAQPGTVPKPLGTGIGGGGGNTGKARLGEALGLAAFQGLERLFDLGNGTNLIDLFLDGTVVTMADLFAKLQLLAGASNVTFNGSETEPLFTLDLTKTIDGEADVEFAFEQFGASAGLRGDVKVRATVNLKITFGVDASGDFFIQTNGADPEIRVTNIELLGSLVGEGQLGILGVDVTNGTVTISGVTLALDFAAPGDRLLIADLTPDLLEELGTATVTGLAGDDVVVTGTVKAKATLPGAAEPFTLGSASLTARWADIANPSGVVVDFTGGIEDFLKVRVEELVAILEDLRAATALLDTVVPGIDGGLADVIDAIKSFDENVITPLTDGLTGEISSTTVQDMMSRISQRLNQELAEYGLSFQGGILAWELPIDFDVLDDVIGTDRVPGESHQPPRQAGRRPRKAGGSRRRRLLLDRQCVLVLRQRRRLRRQPLRRPHRHGGLRGRTDDRRRERRRWDIRCWWRRSRGRRADDVRARARRGHRRPDTLPAGRRGGLRTPDRRRQGGGRGALARRAHVACDRRPHVGRRSGRRPRRLPHARHPGERERERDRHPPQPGRRTVRRRWKRRR